MKKIKISTEYINLGQFLKFTNIIFNGGEAKIFLAENDVKVNNEFENRRGRKLYPNDVIVINEESYQIIKWLFKKLN